MLRPPSSNVPVPPTELAQSTPVQAAAQTSGSPPALSADSEACPVHAGNGGLEVLRELARVNPALARLVNREGRDSSPYRTGRPIQRVQAQEMRQTEHTEARANLERPAKPTTKSRFGPTR